eukprot:TRINITY_DN2935_c0_g9_i1.p2 TRINITY_DN2935_c0_g9~~TRINITY_DN2935_c0_g9_i1.p2  ORF type:complete len:279 (-),score=25.20 TRINITY_DN2935_c0_g9_i1:519-1355(-)
MFIVFFFFFFLMIRRPPRSTHCISSAASDVYKRQLLHCVLQLAIQHIPVGHDDHVIKDCLAVVVSQLDQIVCSPGNRTGLAGAGAVLTQIGHAGAVFLGIGNHGIDGCPLMEARKDQSFLFRPVALEVDNVLLLHIDEVVEDAQPGVALTNLFPEVAYWVFAVLAIRIASMAVPTLVEGQEEGVLPSQLRRHLDFRIRHRKMYDCAPLECQERLLTVCLEVDWQPVSFILLNSSIGRLCEVGLHLNRGNRNPIDEEYQVNRVLVCRVIFELRHNAQPV